MKYQGMWTAREKNLPTDFSRPPYLLPTYAHMATAKLIQLNIVKNLV